MSSRRTELVGWACLCPPAYVLPPRPPVGEPGAFVVPEPVVFARSFEGRGPVAGVRQEWRRPRAAELAAAAARLTAAECGYDLTEQILPAQELDYDQLVASFSAAPRAVKLLRGGRRLALPRLSGGCLRLGSLNLGRVDLRECRVDVALPR
jgi:hypothetical protein